MSLLDRRTTYIVDYPQALEFVREQSKIMWFDDEIKVDKDVQDIRVHLTPSERHGVLTTLQLFTQYELLIGNDYWTELGYALLHPACVSRMANCNSFLEINVHAPFYSKINEALGLATDEFYTSYIKDPILASRIYMLESNSNFHGSPEDVAKSLAMLALSEGAILYSNFAFLKHFQSNGKNKITNIVRGINFSVRDESLHSQGAAWLYRTLISEYGMDVVNDVMQMAAVVREHEHRIVDMIFEKGEIEGITSTQMKNFVDSRVDLVLKSLGLPPLYLPSHNPIAEWFYKGINDYVANDFFQGTGNQYVRTWSEDEFMD